MRDTDTLLAAILGIVGLEFLSGITGIIVGSITGIYLIFRIFHSIGKRKEEHEKRKEEHETWKKNGKKWELEMELLREELATKKKGK